MKKKVILATAITAALAVGLSNTANADEKEKCYGVVKAGKNQCAGNGHNCAGKSSQDSDGNEFVLTDKGLCEKLVNGSLEPSEG